uniref:Uncharacterized protein n=1 Tax=Cacopsylla melanoneura TaxID=428564 RepID=A0A8D8M4L5_9HEMI
MFFFSSFQHKKIFFGFELILFEVVFLSHRFFFSKFSSFFLTVQTPDFLFIKFTRIIPSDNIFKERTLKEIMASYLLASYLPTWDDTVQYHHESAPLAQWSLHSPSMRGARVRFPAVA